MSRETVEVVLVAPDLHGVKFRTDMVDTHRQLLYRILGSVHFANAPSLKKIIGFLCEQCSDPLNVSLKEREIAIGALGRPNTFDSRTDPIIRVSISAIRERLRSYFAAQGSKEELILTIPKGEYRAVFSTRPPSQGAPETNSIQALRRFWHPYASEKANNILVYTDVLFFQDRHGNYTRNIYVNSPSAEPPGADHKSTVLGVADWSPSYHFVSAGEVSAMLLLMQWFHSTRLQLTVRNSRFSSWNEVQPSNLLILGSTRTNSFMAALQGGNNFLIRDDLIENLVPLACEQPSYSAKRYKDGNLEKLTEYAVVTRQPGLTPNTTITMIGANHGRAIEGVGHFLTVEDRVAALLDACGMNGIGALPEHMQFLLRVDMVDFDEEVIHVGYVAHRVV